MLQVCKNYRKSLFFIFACRIGNIFVTLHSSNQRTCASFYESRLTPLFYQKTLKRARCNARGHSEIEDTPIEGQDEDVEDFPSAKVQSRCKQNIKSSTTS